MDVARLDLRTLPVWERPGKIAEAFDRLAVGGSFTVITDNEPRGLSFRIEQIRPHEVLFDPRRTGEREWVVRLTRVAVENDAPSPVGVSLHTIRRGQAVMTENTEWPYLGIVFEGVLALTTGNANGRPRIFLEMFPYDLIGELELFDEAPASGRVIALSKVARYLRLPRRVVLDVAQANPQLLIGIGRINAQRRRDHMQALATQATMPIIARIAHVLVPYAMPERGLSPARAPLPNLTQAQIAAAAGTVKEVAARAIAELEQRELLKRERGHIRYLDRQGLLDMIKDAG
jgi:CRP-like cAMP-binding protein